MSTKITTALGSAVLMACLASTQAAAQTEGDVPYRCNISAATAGVSKTAAITTTDNGATLDFSGGASNSFGDNMGHGLAVSGNAVLTLDTNTNCAVSLSSVNGALWNGKAGAARSYTADAYDMAYPSTKVVLDLSSHPAQPSGTFQTKPDSTSVFIEFKVPDTGTQVLPAGAYTDTLTLTIAPS